MQIPPNPHTGLPQPPSRPGELRNWQVGQVLRAVALADSRGDQVPMRIGRQTYAARVPFEVSQGQRFTLEVIKASIPPVLQPLASKPLAAMKQQALRQSLPRQTPLPPLLANLNQVSGRATGTSAAPLPAPVREAATQLMQQLPTPQRLSQAEGLRRALQDSGLFLEARLAQATSTAAAPGALQGDFKAWLLRLESALRKALVSTAVPVSGKKGARTAAQASPGAANTAPRQAPLPPTAKPASSPSAATTLPRLVIAAPGQARPDRAAPPRGDNARPAPPQNAPVTAKPVAAGESPWLARPLTPPLGEQQVQAQPRVPPSAALLDAMRFLPTLLRDVEGALARVQLHQLASQETDADQRPTMMVELPVRREQGFDLLHLRIQGEAEKSSGGGGENGWRVQIAFDIEPLGPAQAVIDLHGEKVSASFASERAATTRLIERNLDRLSDSLQQAGLQVVGLSARSGIPDTPRRNSGAKPLLDEQA